MSKNDEFDALLSSWDERCKESVQRVTTEFRSRLLSNDLKFEEFPEYDFRVVAGHYEKLPVFLFRTENNFECAITFSTNAMGPEYPADHSFVWTFLEVRTPFGYAHVGAVTAFWVNWPEGFELLWNIVESIALSRVRLKKLTGLRWIQLTTDFRKAHLLEIYDAKGKTLCRSVVNQMVKMHGRSTFGDEFWSRIPTSQ